jgi:STE24 endopeptidase
MDRDSRTATPAALAAATFSTVFLAAIALGFALEAWLAWRQVAHVRAHRDRVPAAFAGRIDLAAHQRAADYTIANTRLALAASAAGALVLVALTRGRGIAFLTGWTGLLDLPPLVQDLVLIVAVIAITSLVSLPFSLYGTFVIEERYGFNRTTWRTWLADLAKVIAVGAALGLPLAALVIAIMAAAGPWWWIVAWLVWMGFQVLVLALYPTVIAPLFNTFKPLADGPLRARIEALLARCGFAAKGVFVIDGSKRSSHGNAYFTGFGRAKRIVFFDTLVDRITPDETEAVLAHELGHYRLRHIAKRLAWSAVASLALFALLAWLAQADWFYRGLTVPPSQERPGVALILFVLVLPVFTFLLTPIGAWYSRKHEYEADAYAARHASADALASALVRLYEDNASTLTPDPVHAAFYASHPPAIERLAHLDRLRGAPAAA